MAGLTSGAAASAMGGEDLAGQVQEGLLRNGTGQMVEDTDDASLLDNEKRLGIAGLGGYEDPQRQPCPGAAGPGRSQPSAKSSGSF